jgi:menaquinone-dependent protoporphyrinogen oxidase
MKKLLITYSTWAGATHIVAIKIGGLLKNKSYDVDIQKITNEIPIENYDGIIIGTSIHAGKTNKDFRNFISFYQKSLILKPTDIFVVSANMISETDKNRQETLEWVMKDLDRYNSFKPHSIGLFGGTYLTEGKDFENLNFFVRKMIKSMKKNLSENQINADFVDNESIENWVNEISDKYKN